MVSFTSHHTLIALRQPLSSIPMLDPQLSSEQVVVESLRHMEKEQIEVISQSTDGAMHNESRRDPMARSPTSPPSGPVQRTGRWTPDEKILFLYGLKRFGKGRWKKMSVYLPHRSLVQIKSHAQKVLKRMEAGENVFRRLDENYNIIDNLVVQAAKQHEALTHTSRTSKSTIAKRKKQSDEEFADNMSPQSYTGSPMYGSVEGLDQPPVDSDVAALAASALCQLSSLPS